jgi:hypothetical protein
MVAPRGAVGGAQDTTGLPTPAIWDAVGDEAAWVGASVPSHGSR